MCFFISFFPATIWAIIGYFVLFSSARADGFVKKLGQFLGVWALILAGFILLGGVYVTVSGMCPIGALMEGAA